MLPVLLVSKLLLTTIQSPCLLETGIYLKLDVVLVFRENKLLTKQLPPPGLLAYLDDEEIIVEHSYL